MGDNEIRLVEGYLKLSEELKEADNQNAEIIKARMEGIIFGYETYTSAHWSTFENLLDKYDYYNQ